MGPGKRAYDTFDDYLFRIARRYVQVEHRKRTQMERAKNESVWSGVGASKEQAAMNRLIWRRSIESDLAQGKPDFGQSIV